jgi:hypothetical protein
VGHGGKGREEENAGKKKHEKKAGVWIRIDLVRIHKGRPTYRKSLQPSKENIQHFKIWNYFTFFYLCGQFLSSWIRIQQFKLMRIRIRNLAKRASEGKYRGRNHNEKEMGRRKGSKEKSLQENEKNNLWRNFFFLNLTSDDLGEQVHKTGGGGGGEADANRMNGNP